MRPDDRQLSEIPNIPRKTVHLSISHYNMDNKIFETNETTPTNSEPSRYCGPPKADLTEHATA